LGKLVGKGSIRVKESIVIEIKKLQKVQGTNVVLDIDLLTIQTGEIIAVIGPSGCGKEILFDLLIKRMPVSTGTIIMNQASLLNQETFTWEVGVLFQDDSLYPNRSVQENLLLHCKLFGLPKDRVDEVLFSIGMADLAGVRISNLASGFKRRVAFARAILHRPLFLILFDPFIRCDLASIQLLSSLIQEQAEDGMSVMILADDEANLVPICDAIYPMSKGQLGEAIQFTKIHEMNLPFKIPVKTEDKVRFINPTEVLFVEADAGYTYLQTTKERLQTQFTLSELEERLSRSGFFRAHRAFLVNLQHVKEVIPYTRNSFSLRLENLPDMEIPLSKTAARDLKELLGY
jgi:ABC-2 type transport system ATP-binding protein